MIFLLSHVHVVAVFWETGSGEDQHAEECSVDPSQPSLPAVCHQRRGKLSCAHQVRPKYGTCLTRSISLTQLYEEVRKSLEQCNIQEDIEHFINLRRTGDKPPGTLSNSFFFFFFTTGTLRSQLLLFISSQFYWNPRKNIFCMRAKDFPTQISHCIQANLPHWPTRKLLGLKVTFLWTTLHMLQHYWKNSGSLLCKIKLTFHQCNRTFTVYFDM